MEQSSSCISHGRHARIRKQQTAADPRGVTNMFILVFHPLHSDAVLREVPSETRLAEAWSCWGSNRHPASLPPSWQCPVATGAAVSSRRMQCGAGLTRTTEHRQSLPFWAFMSCVAIFSKSCTQACATRCRDGVLNSLTSHHRPCRLFSPGWLSGLAGPARCSQPRAASMWPHGGQPLESTWRGRPATSRPSQMLVCPHLDLEILFPAFHMSPRVLLKHPTQRHTGSHAPVRCCSATHTLLQSCPCFRLDTDNPRAAPHPPPPTSLPVCF